MAGSPIRREPAVTSGKPKPTQSTAPSGPSLADISHELKNDSYEYYGLGREKPMTMSVTANGTTNPGSQDVRLLAVKPDEAQFEIISTDALAIMGRNVFALRKDGIHVIESDMTKTDPAEFELPAGLQPGRSWTVNQSSENNGGAMKLRLVQTVVRTEKLKTKVAEYPDALLVTGVGTGTLNGKPLTIETKSWFVKGRGNVKYIIKQSSAGKTAETTVEEIP
ncbi:MAG: hypothetical protein C4320_04775 [Armatimonadota bacterium]